MWKRRLITMAIVMGLAAALVALLYQPWMTQ